MRAVPPTFMERRPRVSLVLVVVALVGVALVIGLGLGTAGSRLVTALLGLLQEG